MTGIILPHGQHIINALSRMINKHFVIIRKLARFMSNWPLTSKAEPLLTAIYL